jgi:phosphate:Na+ symporter
LPRRFSPQGEAEIRDMHLRTIKQVARALNLLQDLSPQRAERMQHKYKKYRDMEIEFMRSHFNRLRKAVPESVATSTFHQELMEQFVRMTSHATNIARIVLAGVSEATAAQVPPPSDGTNGSTGVADGIAGTAPQRGPVPLGGEEDHAKADGA